VQVYIAYLGLRDGNKALLFGFLAEVARDERLENLAPNLLRKALTDDGKRGFSAAESGEARKLLQPQYNGVGFQSGSSLLE
jgi:hypothetical protein